MTLLSVHKNFSNQIDLCPRCVDKPVTTEHFTHTVDHPIARTNRLLHYRNKKSFFDSARRTADRINVLIRSSQVADDNAAPSVHPATKSCACCGNTTSPPCWLCVTCSKSGYLQQYQILTLFKDKDTFVCENCELEDAPCLGKESQHRNSHPLVSYKHVVPEESKTIESKLHALETKLKESTDQGKAIEGKLLALEKRFDDHQEAMTGRLAVLEDLLRMIAAGK